MFAIIQKVMLYAGVGVAAGIGVMTSPLAWADESAQQSAEQAFQDVFGLVVSPPSSTQTGYDALDGAYLSIQYLMQDEMQNVANEFQTEINEFDEIVNTSLQVVDTAEGGVSAGASMIGAIGALTPDIG